MPPYHLRRSSLYGSSLIEPFYQVRKFVIRREVQPKGEGKKPYTKAPRIQRLVTPQRLQHKRHRVALKRRHAEAAKDAAVRIRQRCTFRVPFTDHHDRPSTPRSSTSVLERRRPSRPSSGSAEPPPCASRCCPFYGVSKQLAQRRRVNPRVRTFAASAIRRCNATWLVEGPHHRSRGKRASGSLCTSFSKEFHVNSIIYDTPQCDCDHCA